MRQRARTGCGIVLLWVSLAGAAHAQLPAATWHPELRADVTALRHGASVEVGGGVQVPFGYYTRLDVIGALGDQSGTGSSGALATGRVDLVARFLFDPFRQSRWGISAGGGLTARAVENDRLRPQLVALVDAEGPLLERGFSPALQLGLGGGVRVGVALRWGAKTTR